MRCLGWQLLACSPRHHADVRTLAAAGEAADKQAAPRKQSAQSLELAVFEEARQVLLNIGDWGCRPLDVLLARLSARGCQADEAAVVAVRSFCFADVALPRDISCTIRAFALHLHKNAPNETRCS